MLQLVEQLNQKLKDSQFEGRESTIQRHHSQGKLLARERIEMLIDPDSPFLELMALADCDKPDSQPTSISGIGLVWCVALVVRNEETPRLFRRHFLSQLHSTRMGDIIPAVSYAHSGRRRFCNARVFQLWKFRLSLA